MMRVRFTARALGDLDDIYDFIAKDSKVYANKTVAELITFTRGLAKFPAAGRLEMLPDGTLLRERLFRNYRLTYHTIDGILEIITVQHFARISEEA